MCEEPHNGCLWELQVTIEDTRLLTRLHSIFLLYLLLKFLIFSILSDLLNVPASPLRTVIEISLFVFLLHEGKQRLQRMWAALKGMTKKKSRQQKARPATRILKWSWLLLNTAVTSLSVYGVGPHYFHRHHPRPPFPCKIWFNPVDNPHSVEATILCSQGPWRRWNLQVWQSALNWDQKWLAALFENGCPRDKECFN